MANKYELESGFKESSNYGECIYMQYKLPEVLLELNNYEKNNNNYTSCGNVEHKIIKNYNNNYTFLSKKEEEEEEKYFRTLKKITKDIPNLGYCSIIKIKENKEIKIKKSKLYLVNLMIICLHGKIEIEKRNKKKEIEKMVNNETILMMDDIIKLRGLNKNSTILYIEFMGHSNVNSEFLLSLYMNYINNL